MSDFVLSDFSPLGWDPIVVRTALPSKSLNIFSVTCGNCPWSVEFNLAQVHAIPLWEGSFCGKIRIRLTVSRECRRCDVCVCVCVRGIAWDGQLTVLWGEYFASH